MKEKILIIGAGWEQLPLVLKAKERGLYTIATTTWEKEQIPADKVLEADSRDLEQLERIVEQEQPHYLTADECDYSMYAVAYLAEKYQLHGPSLAVQTITNNKFLQRNYIDRTWVLQPEYQLCWNLEMAGAAAETIGYPVMVKPVDNRGSMGVSKVQCSAELESAWLLGISHSHSRICVIEKCITGQVITADGFCDSRGYEFIAPSNKEMYEENSNLAKVVYYPGSFPQHQFQQIKENAEAVVSAVGMNFGFVHLEFIIEEGTERLYFLEAANRGGGVYTSNLVLQHITGIDYCNALLDLAMGKNIEVRCHQAYISKSIIYFLDLKGDTSIREYLPQREEECKALFTRSQRGYADVKREAAAGRHGVAILSGDSFENLLSIGRKLEYVYCQDEEECFWLQGRECVNEQTGDL